MIIAEDKRMDCAVQQTVTRLLRSCVVYSQEDAPRTACEIEAVIATTYVAMGVGGKKVAESQPKIKCW